MRRLAWVVPLLLAACAEAPNPCAGESTLCFAAEVRTEVSGLDQLEVIVGAQKQRTPGSVRTLRFPLQVGIVLPLGTNVTTPVTIVGYADGAPKASDTLGVNPGQGRVKFTLRATTPDADLLAIDLLTDLTGVTDLAPTTDLSVNDDLPTPPDLAALDLVSSTADLATPLDLYVAPDYARGPMDLNGCSPDASSGQCCGDGVVQPTEECDDANLDNEDACINSCLDAKCSDGYVRAGVEQCDDGNLVNTDVCNNSCAFN